MRRLLLLAAVILLAGLVILAPAASAGAPGAVAANFLRLGTGGRAPALGDAYTGLAEGVGALHYNPAGLGAIERAEVELMYQNLFVDIDQGYIGYAAPLWSSSGWGLSVSYVDYGTIKRTTVADQTGASGQTFGADDLAIGLSYGQRWGDYIYWGATGRYVREKIDNVSASAAALDLGLLAHPAGDDRFAVGLAVKNIGTQIEFDRDGDDLPLLVRGGLSYEFIPDRWVGVADVEWVRHQDATFHVGTEYTIGDILSLRVGWDGRNDAGDGITAGAGFGMDDFDLDYVYIPFGDIGETHRFALRYRFGGGGHEAESDEGLRISRDEGLSPSREASPETLPPETLPPETSSADLSSSSAPGPTAPDYPPGYVPDRTTTAYRVSNVSSRPGEVDRVEWGGY